MVTVFILNYILSQLGGVSLSLDQRIPCYIGTSWQMGEGWRWHPATQVLIPPVAGCFKRARCRFTNYTAYLVRNWYAQGSYGRREHEWAVEPAWLSGSGHMWILTACVLACFLSHTPFLEATSLSKWSCGIALKVSGDNPINVCVCNQWMEKVDTLKTFSPFLCCVMRI